jgi:signal transduction histidine kinase
VATSPGSPAYHVYVGLPLSEVDQSTAELATSLAAGVPLLVVFFAGLTWVFAGRALKPVENLRRQAADISVSDLHRRLDVPGTGDELQRLGVTLNDLLGRLDRSLDRQRQFVADAAHELRSPVAAIQAQAEVADHVAGLASPSPMAVESARLAHLVDDLLALARLDAQPHHRQELLDLDEVVLGEAALVGQVAGPKIDTSGVSPAQVRGDHGQLARAVRNLMENAARYAASRIVVTLRAQEDEAVLVVCDDGPGIPEADRDRILERFTRLDDTRTRSTGGVGLGLAIVNEVVAAHGGQLAIEDGAPGARIVLRLPRA